MISNLMSTMELSSKIKKCIKYLRKNLKYIGHIQINLPGLERVINKKKYKKPNINYKFYKKI